MAYTSKSVLLKDKNNNYLSPVTDIASLFYDYNNINDKIVRRFAIKDNFIVNTSFESVTTDIEKISSTIDPLNQTEELHKLQNSSYLIYPIYNDTSIFVSDVSIVPSNEGNSKFRSFNIKKYDLTSVFLQYTPIQYANYYIYELNAHINDVSKDIHNILQTYTSYDDATYKGKSYFTYLASNIGNISQYINDKNLIPGCIYPLYYNSNVIKNIIAIADSSSSFSNKALGIIENKNNSFIINNENNKNVYKLFDVRFEILDNEEEGLKYVHITYIKDHYNNEAYFDFLNKTYIRPNDYKSGVINNKGITNNKFLSTCNNISIYISEFANNQVKYEICCNAYKATIKNNILNSSLYIDTNKTISIINSLLNSEIDTSLLNNCSISYTMIDENVSILYSDSDDTFILENVIIGKNTIIDISTNRILKNVHIGKNCSINIDKPIILNVHIDDNLILTEVESDTYYTNYKIFARN